MEEIKLIDGRDFRLPDGSEEIIMTSEGLARAMEAGRQGKEAVIVVGNMVIWRSRGHAFDR